MPPPRSRSYFEHIDGDKSTTYNKSFFCICCLETNVPVIKLLTCRHSEFLDNFCKPEMNPDLLVVCHMCHRELKKIKLFKQQVEDSFMKLKNEVPSLHSSNKKLVNFTFHNAVNIQIPETEKPETSTPKKTPQTNPSMKSLDKNLNNIHTALSIIQRNDESIRFLGSSLETLSSNNLLDIIDVFTKMETPQVKNPSNNENIGHKELPSKRIRLKEPEDKIIIDTDVQSTSTQTHQLQPNLNQLQDLNQPQPNLNQLQLYLDQHHPKLIPNLEQLQPILNHLPSTSSYLPPNSISIQPISNQLQPDSAQLRSIPIQFTPTSNQLQLDSNQVKPNSSKVESNSTQVESNSTQVESNSTYVELNSTQYEPISTQSEPNSSGVQSKSNRPNFHRMEISKHLPKSQKRMLKVVTQTFKGLMKERELLMKSKTYLACHYKCETCIIGFKYQDNLKHHLKTKHVGAPDTISCTVCSQKLKPEENDIHLSRHFIRYECRICKKRFRLPDDAVLHYKKIHENVR